ncbi:9514_t:CDS:1, partial [Scutellospora calospora]
DHNSTLLNTLFNVSDVSPIENERMPLVEGITTTFTREEDDDMDIDDDYILMSPPDTEILDMSLVGTETIFNLPD